MHGNATVVYEAEDQARLDGLAAKPWVQLATNTFWVPIFPEETSGREVLPREHP